MNLHLAVETFIICLVYYYVSSLILLFAIGLSSPLLATFVLSCLVFSFLSKFSLSFAILNSYKLFLSNYVVIGAYLATGRIIVDSLFYYETPRRYGELKSSEAVDSNEG